MSVEPGVPDANILAYTANADAPQHAASRALLDAASDPSITLYVTSQTLCEFYSLIASPRRRGMDATTSAPPGHGRRRIRFANSGTMQANGIQRIYTCNTNDFEVSSELVVVTP